jgi:hypothetical protein
MNETNPPTAVGVFDDRRHAKIALDRLCQAGFSIEQIGFVTPDEGPVVEKPDLERGTKASEGAARGAVAGGALGGLVGAALATALIPGVGPVLAGGLLAGLLGGAVTGLAGGGVVGALVGLHIPEEHARHYEREFHSGRTLVTVRAGGRYDEAVAILKQAALVPDEPEQLHPGARAVRLSASEGPGPGGGSVFPGED